MKLFKPILIFLTLALLVPVQSFAGSFRGNPFYFSAGGTFVVPQDSDLGSADPATDAVLNSNNVQMEIDGGLGARAAAGLVLKRRFRMEFEYGYRKTDLDKVSAESGGVKVEVPVAGDFSMNTLMVNGVFDFRNASRFTPYLGAGIGMGLVEVSNPAFTTLGVTVPSGSEDDEVFVYQLYGGVGYWILPQLLGYAEYRYMGSGDAKFNTTFATIDTHNFELGLRFYLGRP